MCRRPVLGQLGSGLEVHRVQHGFDCQHWRKCGCERMHGVCPGYLLSSIERDCMQGVQLYRQVPRSGKAVAHPSYNIEYNACTISLDSPNARAAAPTPVLLFAMDVVVSLPDIVRIVLRASISIQTLLCVLGVQRGSTR
jgi:hypothetical protein